MRTFSGAWPALVTPFTNEDTVNTAVLRALVQHLLDRQVDGFYLCGSTGEGLYMSVDERKLVVEVALDQIQGRAPVIVHVGCVTLRDAVELARHAGQMGAAGISSILPPLYRDTRSLIGYFEALAGAAPDLPLFPYLFGGPDDAVSLMRDLMRIPSIAGTKYTGPDMYELRQVVELRDDGWTVFSGMDQQCVFAAMLGARGNIGSTLNIMPGIYRRIHDCCLSQRFAEALELQLRANSLTARLQTQSMPGALREALRLLGFDCGLPRLPDPSLSEEQRRNLHEQLEDSELFALAAI